jgi:hypothetical protein
MTRQALTLAALTIALTGCPDHDTRPGRDDTSQPADGETSGGAKPGAGKDSGDETGGGETGDASAQACEDELAKVKAELEACQANQPD